MCTLVIAKQYLQSALLFVVVLIQVPVSLSDLFFATSSVPKTPGMWKYIRLTLRHALSIQTSHHSDKHKYCTWHNAKSAHWRKRWLLTIVGYLSACKYPNERNGNVFKRHKKKSHQTLWLFSGMYARLWMVLYCVVAKVEKCLTFLQTILRLHKTQLTKVFVTVIS